MEHKHLLNLSTWNRDDLSTILHHAIDFKKAKNTKNAPYSDVLKGKHWVMLFEKPSLRTRLSFEIGIQKMGGHVVFLDFQQSKMGVRESIMDLAKNVECISDGAIIRNNTHEQLCEFASAVEIPVVNALCELYHPCQALADFQTLIEHDLCNSSTHLVFIGDGNNVCHSLLQLAGIFDLNMTVVTPPGFAPDEQVVQFAQQTAQKAKISVTHSTENLSEADVIYTDCWVSMGSAHDKKDVLDKFASFQVNDKLFDQMGARYFMHCQPITRGEEVTASIADGESSLIYQQSTNRLWSQMALLNTLAKGGCYEK